MIESVRALDKQTRVEQCGLEATKGPLVCSDCEAYGALPKIYGHPLPILVAPNENQQKEKKKRKRKRYLYCHPMLPRNKQNKSKMS